jgi:hypothetical protein
MVQRIDDCASAQNVEARSADAPHLQLTIDQHYRFSDHIINKD